MSIVSDRLPIRDRTLILRILVPGLETRLRDKMKETEESTTAADDPHKSSTLAAASGSSSPTPSNNNNNRETLLDLEGVTCEPTQDNSTLWNFHCDGAVYPARLVNLPCPIELHKTHDHARFYKSRDVAQMLIVYEDHVALDEADAVPKTEGYPSYFHSGITPPLKKVVERKFAMRDHQPRAPPRNEVADVEKELQDLMLQIAQGSSGKGRNKIRSLAAAQTQNKVLEEVSECIVEYVPWMEGINGMGVEFDATDNQASQHPEIWLEPEKIKELRLQERERLQEEERKKEAANAKKQKKKKRKEQKEQQAAAAAAAAAAPSQKKGIASRKNEAPVDDVTQAAMDLTTGDFMAEALEDDFDFGFDLDGDDLGLGDL